MCISVGMYWISDQIDDTIAGEYFALWLRRVDFGFSFRGKKERWKVFTELNMPQVLDMK